MKKLFTFRYSLFTKFLLLLIAIHCSLFTCSAQTNGGKQGAALIDSLQTVLKNYDATIRELNKLNLDKADTLKVNILLQEFILTVNGAGLNMFSLHILLVFRFRILNKYSNFLARSLILSDLPEPRKPYSPF